MEVINLEDLKGFFVKGDTKPHRVQLKELGGKWNQTRVAWYFPEKSRSEVMEKFDLKVENKPTVEEMPSTVVNKYSFSLKLTESGKGFWVSGDTKEHKDILKEVGGKWNSSKKAWVFSVKNHLQPFCTRFDIEPSTVLSH